MAINRIVVEIEGANLPELMAQLETTLQQSIQQPNDNTANAFREKLKEVRERLMSAESNSAHPTWLEAFIEINASSRIGKGLLSRIDKTIQENNMTPSLALSNIKKINVDFKQFFERAKSIDDSLGDLGIEFDDLDDGEFEVGFSIPRKITSDRLISLNKEISEIDYCIRTISEISNEDGSSPSVSTISASNWHIFLDSAPATAACIAITLNKIVNLYKTNLEIKNLKRQLDEKNLPEKVTRPLEEYIEETVANHLRKIGDEIVDEFYKGDEGRKNELKNGLPRALRYLAGRLDKGAKIEVNARPRSNDNEGEENPEITKINQSVDLINKNMSEITSLEVDGNPTLFVDYDQEVEKSNDSD
ncbi:hypothetical protein [Oleiagrimonas sp. MCCC 1A03011]|uniref:hypothetical protein n=1 Tax=Oleiagrimonas sp. MCCC 1A03011 TaxID=1926883 RepID=UPI0011BD7B32|nr:hypothetical protein [Oleiagrimonas sp. MCCC 1A03011]